ncbi:protein-L-isoaspartate O-methyltransferase family protein [Candidatus Phycosocius spiralis]|nr:protein-L-isoaspartate O-methyltransferase [Candidatus Phycosocius spiralis]
MDYRLARDIMIESQVRTNDVSDLALQAAMYSVPREDFVTQDKRVFAYAEVTCPTPSGRELWKPRDFAKLAQAAKVMAGENVLIIGGGGGYSAAVFAALGGEVTILEDKRVEFNGIKSVIGPLDKPPRGLFDVIFVDGGVQRVPDAWKRSLAQGGRLCLVQFDAQAVGRLMGQATIFTKSGSSVAARVVFDAFVPPLPGFEAVAAFTL